MSGGAKLSTSISLSVSALKYSGASGAVSRLFPSFTYSVSFPFSSFTLKLPPVTVTVFLFCTVLSFSPPLSSFGFSGSVRINWSYAISAFDLKPSVFFLVWNEIVRTFSLVVSSFEKS